MKTKETLNMTIAQQTKPKQHKVQYRPLDGVFLLDKAYEISSNTAMQRARHQFAASKAGHCGSLDPLATGMLPICFGQACKYSQYLLDADKTYEVTGLLGVKTTTGDVEGEVCQQRDVDHQAIHQRFTQVIRQFLGPQQQIPPMYSALKHQGKPLYRYARRGEVIERAARDITIHACDILDLSSPTFTLRVHCSKGTYIRVLIEDIGEALGVGAHVTALRRTKVGPLPMAMLTEERLAAMPMEERLAYLHPISTLIQQLPAITVSTDEANRLQNGQKIPWSSSQNLVGEPLALLRANGDFLGVATLSDEFILCPKRIISNPCSL